MPLAFRHRLFLALIGLGTLPLAVALVALALQQGSSFSPSGPRAALDEIAASGGTLVTGLDTAALDSAGRAVLREHVATIARRTALARRAETLTRAAAAVLGVSLLVLAAILVVASLAVARRWARYVSSPIEELVDWVRRVERHDPLPAVHAAGGAPEFAALRDAIQGMARALERARRQELEQERLRAFRETARHVAHEMRGPLTAARLAIRQLEPGAPPRAREVLEEETERLERMAREFAEFGRLPEGPEAPVDLGELVASVVTASVPPDCAVRRNLSAPLIVRGHYEPLRRAVENVVRNAVEATEERGIEITGTREAGTVRLAVRDHGPGIAGELKERVFEPYFTTRRGGTGLGLALVRQTIEAHGGTVHVDDPPGGGATVVLTLPETR